MTSPLFVTPPTGFYRKTWLLADGTERSGVYALRDRHLRTLQQNAWRNANKIKVNARRRELRAANRETRVVRRRGPRAADHLRAPARLRIRGGARHKLWRAENGAKVKAYIEQNRSRIKATRRMWRSKASERLSSSYIKTLINEQYGISFRDIPQVLVEAKRQHLRVKRLLKGTKNGSQGNPG